MPSEAKHTALSEPILRRNMARFYSAIDTSGVLLAIFFSAVGDAASSGQSNVQALKSGLARVQEVGGAMLGDRTMIDALTLALEALPMGFVAAARAARVGADHTAKIVKAKAGRASYISENRLSGPNDPGAEAVALLFEDLAAKG